MSFKCVFASAAIACLAFADAAMAQQTVPRTSDGHPDFHGIWASAGLTTMERLPGATGLVVGDDEAKKLAGVIYARARSPAFDLVIDPNALAANIETLARVNGEWRTSMVTDPPDGKLPLTAEGQRLVAAEQARQGMLSDPEARPIYERCIAGTGTPPFWLVPADNIRQIVQTPGHFVVYTEEGGDLRIIGIGAARQPDIRNSYLGDSAARWDGDVLVVETVGARALALPFRTNPQVVRPQSRVIERFSFISRDEILYRFTVEDPAVYSRPWSAEYSLNRRNVRAFEFGCHEGNYSLPGVLTAARIKETRKK